MATRTVPGAGLLKGLGITLKTMLKPAATQQYPHERPVLEPRTRGVIALMDENCTVCMLCARECPDWCIYIDSHKETVPPAKEGGRARTRNVLDRFAIDFALCMYCGICVEVCPFDALWWSPEFEYAEWDQRNLLHEYDRPPLAGTPMRELPDRVDREYNSLRGWADTVVPPPPLEEGAVPAAEVLDALEKHKNELAKADAAALEAEKAAEEAANPTAAAPVMQELPPEPILADMKIEGETQIDQAVMDQLLADGKSERMARSKAKAAWTKAEKAKLLDGAIEAWKAEVATIEAANAAAASAAPAAGAAAPAEVPDKPILADMKVEGETQIDQAVMDQLLADGKSERMARSKAKAAWTKAEKAKLLEVALVDWEAKYGAAAAAPAEAPAAEAVAEPTLGSVEFEGEVEIDQAVYDDLISQGKSERIARAKAKAAFVKAQKQKMLDAAAGDAPADAATDEEGEA